jgi:hypothetical protein
MTAHALRGQLRHRNGLPLSHPAPHDDPPGPATAGLAETSGADAGSHPPVQARVRHRPLPRLPGQPSTTLWRPSQRSPRKTVPALSSFPVSPALDELSDLPAGERTVLPGPCPGLLEYLARVA